MNRRFSGGLVVFLIVTIVLTAAVWAGTYRAPDRDATCIAGGDCVNGQGIYVSAQPKGDACTPEWLGVISWDLSNTEGEWQSASLELIAYEHGDGGPYTFAIYPATTEDWQENGSAPGYDSSTVLARTTDDLSDNRVGFASDDLGVYFRDKIGGTATIVVALTDGCTGSDAFVRFEDRENSSSRAISEPDLLFWTGHVVNGTPTSATAIEISGMSTREASGGTGWLILAGGVLLVLAGAGFGIRRLRA